MTDLLAILVTDLVDSTAIRARIGEDRADELQRVHDGILRRAIGAAGGDVLKGTGDGIMATFRSATDALGAAVAIQQEFDSYSQRRDAIAPIETRVGIAVGDVVHQDDDIFGTAVIEAARLGNAADAGQILCSELVRTLARGRGGYEFELIGLLELKGLPEPVPTCAVVWSRVGAEAANAVDFGLPEELTGSQRLAFVGRHEEVREAVGFALGAEHAHVQWVLGEPGVGKSRFAAEVSARALDAGAVVLYGRCDELVRDPYQPFIHALRWFAMRLDGDALRSALGADPGPLLRLVPELGTRVPELLEDVGRTTEVEQYRLFESVRSWLADAVPGKPVLFVVDDVHWADRPTLAMLAHVLRSAAPARLFVIATARSTEPDFGEALGDLIDDLARTGRCRTSELGGLSADEVAQLVSQVAHGSDDAHDLAKRITEETAGNALFVRAVLAAIGPSGSGDQELPVDVRSAVRHRVRRLEQRAQDLLQVAALIGVEFSLPVVSGAFGADEDVCLEHIEQAVSAGLVDEIDLDRFRFTHALVRDVLESDLSISRRARLHASIAKVTEAVYAADLSQHLRALATHYAATKSEDLMLRAIDYARRSADQAVEQLAFATAVDDLSFAHDIATRLGSGAAQLRYDLLIARGEAEIMAAYHDAARATFVAAADFARERNDWLQLARAAINYEEATWRPGLFGPEAVMLLREATSHELPDQMRVYLQSSLGRALCYMGDDKGHAVATDALAAARTIGDAATLCHAIDAYVSSLPLDRGDVSAESLELAREAVALARLAGDPTLALDSHANAIYAAFNLGEFDEAMHWLEQADAHAEATGMRFDRHLVIGFRQAFAFALGDLDTAEALAFEELEYGKQFDADLSGTHGVRLFLIRREQGRLRELAPVVRMVLDLNPAEAMWRPGLIAVLHEAGMVDDARRLLTEFAATDLPHLPRDAMYSPTLCLLAEAALRVGVADAHADLERMLSKFEGSTVWIGPTVGFLGPASRYLGLLSALVGRTDEADRRLRDAVELSRKLRTPVWTAHALADRADLLRTAGDASEARVLATEARLLAERHGLVAVANQLDGFGSLD